jgi:manganese/zinc/iron transport system substrate-binding protein
MKNMKKQINILLLLSLVLIMACGGQAGAEGGNGRLQIAATTGQIADAARNVAGDAADVTALLGPGVDPHLYVPTEGDVTTFSEADVIFYNGLHLEAQMLRIMEQMAQNKPVVAIGDTLPEDQLLSWQEDTPHDPHFWNDPALFKLGVEIIRDTLIEADPDQAETYRANAEKYLAEIDTADAYVREQIGRIPPEQRVMVTAHDAFGYFARTYGLEERALQGISTESEAGTQDVQALADFIVERQLPAIFVESSVPPDTIEAVQAAVRDQGFEVTIGGQLFSDALGEEGHEAATYIGMLRYNARTLADALAAD